MTHTIGEMQLQASTTRITVYGFHQQLIMFQLQSAVTHYNGMARPMSGVPITSYLRSWLRTYDWHMGRVQLAFISHLPGRTRKLQAALETVEQQHGDMTDPLTNIQMLASTKEIYITLEEK
jgi:hypothetical protein